LKGEESLELRLMDDISLPATLAFGPMRPDRPPYASSAQPSSFTVRGTNTAEPAVDKNIAGGDSLTATGKPPVRYTILVLKSNETFTLSKYRRYGDVLVFEQVDGTKGAVDLDLVDWRKTTERNQQTFAD
jgi:hypothetical protein